jgi:hypothetical protein
MNGNGKLKLSLLIKTYLISPKMAKVSLSIAEVISEWILPTIILFLPAT